MADALDSKLDNDEFHAMLDEVEALKNSGNGGNAIGAKVMTGSLVNEKTSKAFIESAKSCSA
mgnify:CR=1 FL=1